MRVDRVGWRAVGDREPFCETGNTHAQHDPARVDTSHPGDRSWFFYAPSIADTINDLGSAPFGTRMDNTQFVIFPGAFMVRATGVPVPSAPTAAGLLAFGVVASRRRR